MKINWLFEFRGVKYLHFIYAYILSFKLDNYVKTSQFFINYKFHLFK